VIEAKAAGQALEVVANKLLEHSILLPEGFAVMQRVAGEMKRIKGGEWTIEVDRGNPIQFSPARDKHDRAIRTSIVAAGIHVIQDDRKTPPFKALDVAIEITLEDEEPISRWHLDLANCDDAGNWQSGPLVHLQYGGHHHDARHLDHPLKVPRWCHPPLELALLSEVVAANFFEEAWLALRDDPNWCAAICLYQKLCFERYAEKLASTLSISSVTALSTMWAANWD
jgi:hypothetical protein